MDLNGFKNIMINKNRIDSNNMCARWQEVAFFFFIEGQGLISLKIILSFNWMIVNNDLIENLQEQCANGKEHGILHLNLIIRSK